MSLQKTSFTSVLTSIFVAIIDTDFSMKSKLLEFCLSTSSKTLYYSILHPENQVGSTTKQVLIRAHNLVSKHILYSAVLLLNVAHAQHRIFHANFGRQLCFGRVELVGGPIILQQKTQPSTKATYSITAYRLEIKQGKGKMEIYCR